MPQLDGAKVLQQLVPRHVGRGLACVARVWPLVVRHGQVAEAVDGLQPIAQRRKRRALGQEHQHAVETLDEEGMLLGLEELQTQ